MPKPNGFNPRFRVWSFYIRVKPLFPFFLKNVSLLTLIVYLKKETQSQWQRCRPPNTPHPGPARWRPAPAPAQLNCLTMNTPSTSTHGEDIKMNLNITNRNTSETISTSWGSVSKGPRASRGLFRSQPIHDTQSLIKRRREQTAKDETPLLAEETTAHRGCATEQYTRRRGETNEDKWDVKPAPNGSNVLLTSWMCHPSTSWACRSRPWKKVQGWRGRGRYN